MSVPYCAQLNNHADLNTLAGWGTAPRLLRMLQSWATSHETTEGRGTVYLVRAKWLELLGVTLRTLQRAVRRLESSGWLRRCWVRDDLGREVEGYEVAIESRAGFAVEPSPDRRESVASLSPPSTVENKGNETQRSGAAMAAPSRPAPQVSMFDLDVVAPRVPQPDEHQEHQDQDRREKREAAERVAAYERKRYAEHPRCVRPKRSDARSVKLVVDAIFHALESGVSEVECRAAIELQWSRAVDNAESWSRWTGVELWKGSKLPRLLAWLEEPRNEVYMRIADGRDPAPTAQSMESPQPEVDPLEVPEGVDRHALALFESGTRWRPSLDQLRQLAAERSLALDSCSVVDMMAAMIEDRGGVCEREWAAAYLATLVIGQS